MPTPPSFHGLILLIVLLTALAYLIPIGIMCTQPAGCPCLSNCNIIR